MGDFEIHDFKVIISVCLKMARGKVKKVAQKVAGILDKTAKGTIFWSPQHIQYTRNFRLLSTPKRGGNSKSAFCMKRALWFCTVSHLENGGPLCYITIRKGDTDVQVSTWGSRKGSRNRRKGSSPRKSSPTYKFVPLREKTKEKRKWFGKRAPKVKSEHIVWICRKRG